MRKHLEVYEQGHIRETNVVESQESDPSSAAQFGNYFGNKKGFR